MDTNEIITDVAHLIEEGNRLRGENRPDQALKCYMLAMVQDPNSAAAFNNYGNVMRECGFPKRGVPFLQYAIEADPTNITAKFNLAVSYLIMGDYARGWPAYEARWQYEHLAGTEPQYKQPRWRGEDLQGKTILVVGEQGHGDNIQFARFLLDLSSLGAEIIFQTTDALIPLFSSSAFKQTISFSQAPEGFDYWIPIMSIPAVIGVTLENLPQNLGYIQPNSTLVQEWHKRLGPKKRLRVGFCWSGRKDSWINQHKGMPFVDMLTLIKQNPDYEWINLQADCTPEEESVLTANGVAVYSSVIHNFGDTAALIQHLDVVLSVDTAVAHMSGAIGRPTWVMLNQYALDWRWLLNRDDSPWYPSARLFRQPAMGDWQSVTKKIHQYLTWFKI
jgi:hypothetical protein